MLEKIKEFFRNIFNRDNTKYIETPQEVEKKENDNIQKNTDFKNRIVISNEDYNRALKLQSDYRAGIINEEELTEEEFDLLTALYDKQINEVKESIENYKNKIESLKSETI